MKILVSLLVIGSCLNTWASCSFKSQFKKVISLSGPMTILLRETQLLNDPALEGISIFNPISENEFRKKRIPGGIFLSQRTLSEFENALIFYDEGRELRKILSTGRGIQSVEIKTRNKYPIEVVDSLIRTIRPLTNGCDQLLSRFKANAVRMEMELLKKLPSSLKVVFYLGRFKNQRPPELVIVNDGVVKKLIQENKIKTYPSELSYVNWSSKIMDTLSKDFIHLGIEDSGSKLMKEIKRSSMKMTLIYPGALVPGFSQLEAFLFWANSL